MSKRRRRRGLLWSTPGLANFVASAIFCLIFPAQIHAQSQAGPASARLPKFEVASIRPNSPSDLRIGFWFTPDGISVTGAPLQMILGVAFHEGGDHIFGEPGWVKSARYDIQAKVAEADVPMWRKLTMDQQRPALQSLLMERFNLRFHRESRELPIYTLMVAKGGSRLKESKAVNSNGEPAKEFLMWTSPDHLEGRNASVEDLLLEVAPMVGDRTIVNKTGLTGSYDFALQLNRADASQTAKTPSGLPGPGIAPDPDAGDTELFAALREQLGLNLTLKKLPVDVIVIDNIERPSAN